MIISLSGAHGSGKSTVAQMLAEKLGWPRYYIGGLRRQAAEKRGLTLAEYNQLGETDPQTDKEVDEYQRELGQTQDNFIIEGRTSWYFIPHSLKIYLDVSEKEGARRIFQSLKNKERSNEDKHIETEADALMSMKRRLESDKARYQKYYGIDVYDKKHYDLYLDTSNLTPEQVFDEVYRYIQVNIDKS